MTALTKLIKETTSKAEGKNPTGLKYKAV